MKIFFRRLRSEFSDALWYYKTGMKTWSPYHDSCHHRTHPVWRNTNEPQH